MLGHLNMFDLMGKGVLKVRSGGGKDLEELCVCMGVQGRGWGEQRLHRGGRKAGRMKRILQQREGHSCQGEQHMQRSRAWPSLLC